MSYLLNQAFVCAVIAYLLGLLVGFAVIALNALVRSVRRSPDASSKT